MAASEASSHLERTERLPAELCLRKATTTDSSLSRVDLETLTLSNTSSLSEQPPEQLTSCWHTHGGTHPGGQDAGPYAMLPWRAARISQCKPWKPLADICGHLEDEKKSPRHGLFPIGLSQLRPAMAPSTVTWARKIESRWSTRYSAAYAKSHLEAGTEYRQDGRTATHQTFWYPFGLAAGTRQLAAGSWQKRNDGRDDKRYGCARLDDRCGLAGSANMSSSV